MNRGRLKRVHVTPEAIESWLVDGPSAPCSTNLPKDAEIVDWYRSKERGHWVFVFESEEWEMLEEGERIPKFKFHVTEQYELVNDEPDENIEHDTPECPNCGSTKTRPIDDEWATCFGCGDNWKMTEETREAIDLP